MDGFLQAAGYQVDEWFCCGFWLTANPFDWVSVPRVFPVILSVWRYAFSSIFMAAFLKIAALPISHKNQIRPRTLSIEKSITPKVNAKPTTTEINVVVQSLLCQLITPT